MNNAYETTVKLPSEGFPYDDGVKELTIRPMTTKEEKYIYGSSASRSDNLVKLVNACIVENSEGKKLDASSLMPGDFDYLLTKLRVITYGPEYHQVGICPYCSNVDEFEVSLDELTPTLMDEDTYVKYQTVELSTGDKVEQRILTSRQIMDVTERVDKVVRKSKTTPDRQFLMVQHLRAAEIVSVNGEKYTHEKALLYLDTLLARDSAKLDAYNNRMLSSFGAGNSFSVTCTACSEGYDLDFVNHGEFFRPRFD